MSPLPVTSADLPPMDDRAIGRFTYRVGLFKRRGWDTKRAEAWADRLYQRDIERDPRRLCIECTDIQRNGRCATTAKPVRFGSLASAVPGASILFEVIPDRLQRCPYFNFQLP